MRFADITGQDELKQQLIQQVQRGQVAHAQLLLGKLGYGGLPVALAFAQYLHCHNPSATDSCGECPSCRKAEKFVHPDIHFSIPTVSLGKNKPPITDDFIHDWREAISGNPYLSLYDWLRRHNAENKQANITVREAEEILRKLNLKTFESKYKVLIMWLPEYLREVGNKLLKILEEPPEGTVFLLVAENSEQLLNTILSRTQILKVKKIRRETLANMLVQRHGMTEGEAVKMAAIANGDCNEALRLLNNTVDENAERFTQWMACLLKEKGGAVENLTALHKWTEDFGKIGRENQKNFIAYALFFLREAMVTGMLGEASPALSTNEQHLAEKIKHRLAWQQLQQLNEWLNTTYYYIERNANPRLQLMTLSLRAGRLFHGRAKGTPHKATI